MRSIACSFFSLLLVLGSCAPQNEDAYSLTHDQLRDKIKGAWAAQTIGVTYGGPTEFRYNKRIIPDSVDIEWSDTMMLHWMTNIPGLYDDIYMDLTFVEVLEKEGMEAPASSFARPYAEAEYWLWHANQQGRYNFLHGMEPPASGHWTNNPHADDIDFQIEADFAGIMNPGMPASALEICDRVGHIMNSGDGYYGGVFVAGMYSYAFIMDDLPQIIRDALTLTPEASTFHQCIADVIDWHAAHPQDWKQTWQLLEDKWGKDIGCPDGALRDFNIDAKLNAAYVVLGLLYGEGDFGKTMEIATRAGQDSDCNPATAAAVLGTVTGYRNIPEKWARGLAYIEDMDFQYTTISLNEACELSYRHALEMIRRNGGEVAEESVRIPRQEAPAAPLEQNFPGYDIAGKKALDLRLTYTDTLTYTWDFTGIGVVLRGKVGNLDFPDKYALLTPEETLEYQSVTASFFIDGKPAKTMDLPLNFIKRAHELFFLYELPPGKHTLRMEITDIPEKAYVDIWDMLVYEGIGNREKG